jgi:hypothetical protein
MQRAVMVKVNHRRKSMHRRKIPSWKKVAPADGEQKTIIKIINDRKKTFHWCPHHQMWTIHLPKDCTYSKEGNDSNKNQTERKTDKQTLMINKTLFVFLNEDIDESCRCWLTSVGKLIYYFLPCMLIMYLYVIMIQMIEVRIAGIAGRPMFVCQCWLLTS